MLVGYISKLYRMTNIQLVRKPPAPLVGLCQRVALVGVFNWYFFIWSLISMYIQMHRYIYAYYDLTCVYVHDYVNVIW